MRESAARSAFSVAGLAACAVALSGADAGLLWLVAGVFAVRALSGGPVGAAWALACLGAGLRWGSLGLGDVQTATRLLGPTVLAGPLLVRAGMALALVAAVSGEARIGDAADGPVMRRAAAVVAVLGLVPLYVVTGPIDLAGSAAPWAAATAAVMGALLAARPLVAKLPGWVPVAVAAAGVTLAVLAA